MKSSLCISFISTKWTLDAICQMPCCWEVQANQNYFAYNFIRNSSVNENCMQAQSIPGSSQSH